MLRFQYIMQEEQIKPPQLHHNRMQLQLRPMVQIKQHNHQDLVSLCLLIMARFYTLKSWTFRLQALPLYHFVINLRTSFSVGECHDVCSSSSTAPSPCPLTYTSTGETAYICDDPDANGGCNGQGKQYFDMYCQLTCGLCQGKDDT